MVGNVGAFDYTFNGVADPTIVLVRGCSYTFDVNTPGHPLLIKSVQSTGAGNQYNDGVMNNGASVGVITWDVPLAAPDTLYYNCEFHGGMTGEFSIIDPV